MDPQGPGPTPAEGSTKGPADFKKFMYVGLSRQRWPFRMDWEGGRTGNQCTGVAEWGLRGDSEKAQKAFDFSAAALFKVRPVMAWQDLCVREWRPQRWEEKPWPVWTDGMPGECDAAEELAGCRSPRLPRVQSRNPSGKKPREVIASVQGFQNTILCGGNCGNEVLKSWGVKIRKDAVTWPGVWVGFGMLLSSHHDARPGCLTASRAGCSWEPTEIRIKPPAFFGVTAPLWVTYWKQPGGNRREIR